MIDPELSGAPLLFPMRVELGRPEYCHRFAIVRQSDSVGARQTILDIGVDWQDDGH